MNDLRPIDDRVLVAVRELTDRYGCSPSQVEIAGVVGMTPAAVASSLARLRAAGRLTYAPNRRRSLELVDVAA